MRVETSTVAPPMALPWPWRIASVLATAIGAVLLAFVIATWGWRWFAPPSPPPVAASLGSENWVAAIVAAPLFGRVAAPAKAAAEAPAALLGDTRLLGVFAEKEGTGYALFRVGTRGAVLVQAGQDISQDLKLLEVRPEGVRVRERGETRDLSLRAIATESPIAPPRSASGGCAPPPGYQGAVYRLNAELLTGIASRPEGWQTVLMPVAGGLAIRDGSGFAAMLGMKPGDRMAQANGIALAGIDDVLVAFVKPLLASQVVRGSGTRDGKPADWLFVNAGACTG